MAPELGHVDTVPRLLPARQEQIAPKSVTMVMPGRLEHREMDKYTHIHTHAHRVNKAPAVSVTVGMKEDEKGEREVRQDDEIVEFSLRQLKKTQRQDHR